MSIPVNDVTPRVQYTASAAQTVFPYGFLIYDQGDLVVISSIDGTLSIGTDYTVSGVGVATGGNVTLTSGATAGEIFTIYRDMALERQTDFAEAGDLLADTMNTELDKIVMMIQQLNRDIDLTASLSITSVTSGVVIPEPTALSFLRWNAAGTNLENATLTATGTLAVPASPTATSVAIWNGADDLGDTGVLIDGSDNVSGIVGLTTTGTAVLANNFTVSTTGKVSGFAELEGTAKTGQTFEETYITDLSADASVLRELDVIGENSAAATKTYVRVRDYIDKNTAGAEDGERQWHLMGNGVVARHSRIRNIGDVGEMYHYAIANFNHNWYSERNSAGLINHRIWGRNDVAAYNEYARYLVNIDDDTDGSEAGEVAHQVCYGGSLVDYLRFQGTTNTLTIGDGTMSVVIDGGGTVSDGAVRLEYDQTVPSVTKSSGVSSVTDNSVGNFTVNFSSAFSGTDYFIGGAGPINTGVADRHAISSVTKSTGNCVVEVRNSGGTLEDVNMNLLEFFEY